MDGRGELGGGVGMWGGRLKSCGEVVCAGCRCGFAVLGHSARNLLLLFR